MLEVKRFQSWESVSVRRVAVSSTDWLDLSALLKCFCDALQQLFNSLHVLIAPLRVILLILHCFHLSAKDEIQHDQKKRDRQEADECVTRGRDLMLRENVKERDFHTREVDLTRIR
jgi:quinol-cytochrome oxidoreductase complex cytochrome b subunit